MSAVYTHTFSGVKYEVAVLEGSLRGLCSSPHGREPRLVLCCDLESRGGLETAIHEALHASFFAQTEEKVTSTAYDVARFLWRLGYRI